MMYSFDNSFLIASGESILGNQVKQQEVMENHSE